MIFIFENQIEQTLKDHTELADDIYRIICFDESPLHAATEKEVDPERRVYDAKLSLNSVPRYCVTEGGDGNVSLCTGAHADGQLDNSGQKRFSMNID